MLGPNNPTSDLIKLVQALDLSQDAVAQEIIRKNPKIANQVLNSQQKMLPLMLSIYQAKKCCHAHTFQALLSATTAVNAQNYQGKGVIHWLAYYGSLKDVRYSLLLNFLRRKGVNVNLRTANLETPLYMAVYAGNAHAVQALIEAGADVNLADHVKRSPLHVACIKGYETIILLLLKAGAKVTALDAADRTPIEYLAQCQVNDAEMINNILNKLLEHGATVNKSSIQGAAAYGQPVVKDALSRNRVPSLLNQCVRKVCESQQLSTFFPQLPYDLQQRVAISRKP